jgi:hypothetical protein
MTVLTQDLADLAGREDGEKAGDARTGCEHGQFVCVEFGNLLDRHVRLAGQGFDGSLVYGTVVGMRHRGKHSHGVAFVRFEHPRCRLKACKIPLRRGQAARVAPGERVSSKGSPHCGQRIGA